MSSYYHRILALVLLALATVSPGLRSITTLAAARTPSSGVQALATVTPSGGRPDWSPVDNNLIALDKLGTDGLYYVATMHPDGTGEVCLTCGVAALPAGHKGNPTWHPSGQWLIFQAQKPKAFIPYFSLPGYGAFSDLWAMSVADRRVYQLTTTPVTNNSGVLHPHFSSDGKKLSWSEMYQKGGSGPGQSYGYWKLKVADFVLGPAGASLANIQDVTPTTPAMYENHGFSPDGTKLIFTTNANLLNPAKPYSITNIFTMDRATHVLKQLTHDEGGHNEHAAYSPDGKHIIWMTGRDNANLGTDFWMMNSDGSNPTRLTYYNKPGYPEYRGHNVYAAKSAWSPDGTRTVGYVQDNLGTQSGGNVLVSLTTPAGTNLFNPFVHR